MLNNSLQMIHNETEHCLYQARDIYYLYNNFVLRFIVFTYSVKLFQQLYTQFKKNI